MRSTSHKSPPAERLVFPFSKAEPTPTADDPTTELSVDPDTGREAFSRADA